MSISHRELIGASGAAAVGWPTFDLYFCSIEKDGTYGSACADEASNKDSIDTKLAVADAKGARLEARAHMLRATERPKA